MGTPATPEASEIRRRGRQRLLGAVAIALVLIVFVPMILDSDPRPPRNDAALVIPPKENAPPLPAPMPAAQPGAAPKSAAAPSQPPQPSPSSTPGSDEAKPPAAKVAVVEPKQAASGAPPAAARQGFAVQVGAFRDDAKLAQARERLQSAKIAHYTEPAGGLTRLRAGPFTTRDAADKAAIAIRKSHPEAKVVPLP